MWPKVVSFFTKLWELLKKTPGWILLILLGLVATVWWLMNRQLLLKKKLLKSYDNRGAEYPAEHNVGHEYFAKPTLSNFYKKLDPTNSMNPGIGQTSKRKHWK